MLRVVRLACCIVVLMLVSAAGCDDEPRRPKGGTAPSGPSASSASVTPTDVTTVPTSSPVSSDPATRSSQIATRTGFTITHNGQPIDTAGLRALGWTINAVLGTAQWSDPALGSMSVTWEIPDERAVSGFDASFWGDVTAQNLAMNPTMSTSVFTGGPVEATAYSTGGRKAETPTKRLVVTVPEQPVGTTATVSMNLGWPQPVLITYNYTYV
ncbi:hypothetical protein D0Z08_24045 [Nocardioides immobilis]|uniref:Uncharacterized protein n=1 Tax=Nocardioides immobilis TaxID=2049295 RepID=A0A417XWE3_9ACTN|nr:hypothetical protein [Nocardioides immobilis]RHW24591.1 hypothetical protein D0Z08_24045 [Nocardioides immobilis]